MPASTKPPLSLPIPPPTPIPTPLKNALITALLSTHTIPLLQQTLHTASQQTGFLDALRDRSLQLLRSGECISYGEVMARVVGEVRGEGSSEGGGDGEMGAGEALRVPGKLVEAGVKVLREALGGLVVFEEESGEGV